MSTYTPGPWHVGPYYKSDIESRHGSIGSLPMTPQGIEDAAFIVRACNSHEAMLEALKRFAQAIKADNYDQDLLVDIYHDVREAIRLAEGGQP